MIERIITAIETVVEWTGRIVAWFTLAAMLVVCAVVVLRYFFGLGWASLQELYVYFHASAFMLGAAYTLKHEGHVRVDVIYGHAGPHYKRGLNILGCYLLLIPVMGWLFYTSLPFVADSWSRLEGSHQSGGLPGVFILKTIIPITCALLILQAVCLAYRAAKGGDTTTTESLDA
ncbi:TRAP transporter small permease subunit [Roseovarius aestuarii]|nr:TRAP transporter small permease subunit [Roseovarius aestuarii]